MFFKYIVRRRTRRKILKILNAFVFEVTLPPLEILIHTMVTDLSEESENRPGTTTSFLCCSDRTVNTYRILQTTMAVKDTPTAKKIFLKLSAIPWTYEKLEHTTFVVDSRIELTFVFIFTKISIHQLCDLLR